MFQAAADRDGDARPLLSDQAPGVASGVPKKPDRDLIALVLMLGFMSVLSALSINMYVPALPAVARSLGAPLSTIQVSVAVFMVGISGGQLFWGAVSERLGRRPPLYAGMALFFVASCACASAGTVAQLCSARFAQGLGACAGLVLARSIISDQFEGKAAAVIFSWQQLIIGIGPIFAPMLGAVLLSTAGWRSIFWVLAGVGLTLLVVLSRQLRESRSAETAARARSETALQAYASLLRNPRVSTRLLAAAFAAAPVMTWYGAASPLFQDTFGWSTGTASWVIGGLGVTIIAATQLNRSLLQRYEPGSIVRFSLTVAIAVSALMALAITAHIAPPPFVAGALVFTVSLYGLMVANLQAALFGEDRARSGSISALFGSAVYAVGGAMAGLVSVLPPAGGLTMMLMIATQSLIAWLLLHWLGRYLPAADR